jgi:hypothetical protein
VPDDLRELVGKREEKHSLKTKNASEAKKLMAQALLDLDQYWTNLRRGPVFLNEADAHALAAPVYDRWIAIHADNPSEQRIWNTEIGVAGVWDPPPPVQMIPLHLIQAYENAEWTQRRCFETADEIPARFGVADNPSLRRTAIWLQQMRWFLTHLSGLRRTRGSPFCILD